MQTATAELKVKLRESWWREAGRIVGVIGVKVITRKATEKSNLTHKNPKSLNQQLGTCMGPTKALYIYWHRGFLQIVLYLGLLVGLLTMETRTISNALTGSWKLSLYTELLCSALIQGEVLYFTATWYTIFYEWEAFPFLNRIKGGVDGEWIRRKRGRGNFSQHIKINKSKRLSKNYGYKNVRIVQKWLKPWVQLTLWCKIFGIRNLTIL